MMLIARKIIQARVFLMFKKAKMNVSETLTMGVYRFLKQI